MLDVKKISSIPLSKVRNIGIIAHIDAGKTTVSERILYYTGRIHKTGEVHDGAATMDSMKQEQERGITITSAATTYIWDEYRGNLIDTPGHVDFTVEVERALRVLDGAVTVFDGVEGVEPQSQTVWGQADKFNIPRICFVNKMDRLGANFSKCLKSIKDKLKIKPLVISIPMGDGKEFSGIIDLVEEKLITWSDDKGMNFSLNPIPESMASVSKMYRDQLIDDMVDSDDDFMSLVLEDPKAITTTQIRDSLRKILLGDPCGKSLIMCGSALKNRGIQQLLDNINIYLPSPLDRPLPVVTYLDSVSRGSVLKNDISMVDAESCKLSVLPLKNNGPKALLIFKTQFMKVFGNVAFARVYSGVFKKGEFVYNVNKKIEEKISRIVLIDVNNFNDINEAVPGNVYAIIFRDTNSSTGDSIGEKSMPILLDNIKIPDPVVDMAIEPHSKGDISKLISSLKILSFDDPSLRFYQNDYGQIILKGMGELHLSVIVSRLSDDFGIKSTTHPPQVAYRETVCNFAEVDHIHKKQTGGAGQFARVVMSIDPLPLNSGIEFVSKIIGGNIPSEYISPIEKSIKDTASGGVHSIFPVSDFRITLLDGAFHDVDSSAFAFSIAARDAFKSLLEKGLYKFLEPVMYVTVQTPEAYLGNVIGDISSRRGEIIKTIQDGDSGKNTIECRIPLEKMFGYVDILRSKTQGYGQYHMEFDSYRIAPSSCKIAPKHGPSAE